MLKAINYWLWEYINKGFVRFAIVDKEYNEVIGTIELFNRHAEDFFSNCGIVRLDVRSDYENREELKMILSIILEPSYKLFQCEFIATKAPIYAVERIAAIKKMGFEKTDHCLVGQHDNEIYKGYWIRNVVNC